MKLRNLFRRGAAALLSLSLVVTAGVIPQGKSASAAGNTSVDLKADTSVKTVNVPESGSTVDLNLVSSDYNTFEKLKSAGITGMTVTYKVTSFTSDGYAGVQPFFCDDTKSSGNWVSGGVWNNISSGAEDTVKLDFKSYSGYSGGSGSCHYGIQFANLKSVSRFSYQIVSASLNAEGGASSGDTGDDSSFSQSGDVTAKLKVLSGSPESDWVEYNYSVTNGLKIPISGVQIKIPYSGSIQNPQSWGGPSVSAENGVLTVTLPDAVKAGETVSCMGSQDTKFGFGGGAILGEPKVTFIYGTGGKTSSSKLSYTFSEKTKDLEYSETPFGIHGKLSLKKISGYSQPVITDKNGKQFTLRGASSHGIQWDAGRPFINEGAFHQLRDEFGVNAVRLACYAREGGYGAGNSGMDSTIQRGVEAATKLGMYVIIDWHVLAFNPNEEKNNAENFFKKYAAMYKDYDNVLFEVCNEPTGANWYSNDLNDLHSYCRDLVSTIRKAGAEDQLVICGTNTWSQDIDQVEGHDLNNEGFKNILYTLHFYAGDASHEKLKSRVKEVTSAGIPVFVSEFGTCAASGNGGFNYDNSTAWIDLLDSLGISYFCWALSNKGETASYFKTSCTRTDGGWTEDDLSDTGVWLVNTYRKRQDKEEGTDTTLGNFSAVCEPAGGNLSAVSEKYRYPGKAVVTIKNTGKKGITGLTAKLSLGEWFKIVKAPAEKIPAGESTTCEVQLVSGLGQGKYYDALVIETAGMSKSFNISQEVQEEGKISDPSEAPEETPSATSEAPEETLAPTEKPTATASVVPVNTPEVPTATPVETAAPEETLAPTEEPTATASVVPVNTPEVPTVSPAETAEPEKTLAPTEEPTATASVVPVNTPEVPTASPVETAEPEKTTVPTETPVPSPTVEPSPTANPAPTETPAPTEEPSPTASSTPAASPVAPTKEPAETPEVTETPAATSAAPDKTPGAPTAVPAETTAPEETAVPEETETPSETALPEETSAAPDVTAAPSNTELPEIKTEPDETGAPSETAVPSETEKPSETALPVKTTVPGETELPSETPVISTETPAASVSPAQTSTAPVTESTVPAGSTEAPKQSESPAQSAAPSAASSVNPDVSVNAGGSSSLKITGKVKATGKVNVRGTYRLAPGRKLTILSSKHVTVTGSNSKVRITGGNVIKAGRKAGVSVITVTDESGNSVKFKVRVMKKAVKNIRFVKGLSWIKAGKKARVRARVYPGRTASGKIKYIVNNKKALSITQSGVVKAKRRGRVIITAAATDGSGKRARIAVRIK